MNTQIDTRYGTKLVSNPTYLEDIAQTLYVREHSRGYYNPTNDLPFSYSNVANILRDKLNRMGVIPKVYEDSVYCSLYPDYNAKDFMFTFDLQLHDAAVSYTYLAQETGNKEYASIACDLWYYSRQLRIHHTEETFKQYGRNQVMDGIGVTLKDIVKIVINTVKNNWYFGVGYNLRQLKRRIKSAIQ